MNANQLLDFPVLSEELLRDITTGIYQIKLAPGYVQDKMEREGDEEFQIEMLRDAYRLPEPGLLRVRVYSRFRNATKYQLWIGYAPDNIIEPIREFYCTCKSGSRTLGTCAHITSILWFLGYARHEERVSYPTHLLINNIQDAGNRPRQGNPH